MSDLIVTPINYHGELLVKFTMSEFEVDGICYKNPQHLFERLMISAKHELTPMGNVSDTGLEWQYSQTPISETHWMSCGTATKIGEYCEVCFEVAK